MVTILEAATSAGISKDKARYWLKLLEVEPIKKDRKLLFPAGSISLLEAMKSAILSGLSPAAAAVEVNSVHALPCHQEPKQIESNQDLSIRMESLEKGILLLAEQNRKLLNVIEKQERTILAQSFKIDSIKLSLEAPKKTSLEVWQPKEKKAPQYPALLRLWYGIVSPEKLRAY